MTHRSATYTARRVPCPTCHAPRFEYCLSLKGEPQERSHPERCRLAEQGPGITPAMEESLRRLHIDEYARLEPIVRLTLLRRGLVTSPDPAPGPTGSDLRRPKRRRHPLTDLGREAIGVQVEEKAS